MMEEKTHSKESGKKSLKSDEEGELEEMPAVSSSETSLVFFKSTWGVTACALPTGGS